MSDHPKDIEQLRTALRNSPGVECETLLTALTSDVEIAMAAPKGGDTWLRHLAEVLIETHHGGATLHRVEILISIAWWLAEKKDHKSAVQLLESARDIADEAGALALKRRVLNSLGGIHHGYRNATDATISFVEALKLAEQLGDALARCAIIANVASMRLTMGMLDDAIKLSKLVIHLCGNQVYYRSLRAQAHHDLAEAYLLLADTSSAREHAERALADIGEPSSALDGSRRVMMEATLVRALVALGDYAAAVRHTEATLIYASIAKSHTASIQSQLCLALCDAVHGRVDIALTRLASIEPQLTPSDISFRDFMEVELISNQRAGQKQFARYYNKKYLSALAEFQRKRAIEQVYEVKRYLQSGRADIELSSSRKNGRQRSSPNVMEFGERMEGLAVLAELREDASGEHSYRVGALAKMLALAVGRPELDALMIEQAARLHDIGKLGTPDAVLLKRGRLTTAESEIMRRHATEGSQILTDFLYAVEESNSRSTHTVTLLRLAAEVAHNHHEWWDGSGYPRGIAGEAIPEAARIVALADVFDDLTNKRPYREPWTKAKACKHLLSLSGKQFQPELCDAFIGLLEGEAEIPTPPQIDTSPFIAAHRLIGKIVAEAH